MIVILIISLIFIGSLIINYFSNNYDDFFCSALAFFSGVILAVFLIALPIHRADTLDQIAQRNALQNTYNNLRKNNNQFEMATVGKDIAEWNAWLASAQYWHNTQWSWYWPKEVMTTKPIE